MFNVLISKSAKSDLNEIHEYYKLVSEKVGKNFINKFEKTIDQIKINPYFQIRYDDFRIKQIAKFPILIHYIVDEKTKTVKVFGIRHAKRNPKHFTEI